MMAIFGALLPRFALLVGWANDPGYWNTVSSRSCSCCSGSWSCRGPP